MPTPSLPKILLPALGVAVLVAGAWYLGRSGRANAGGLTDAASRSELQELRAELERQQRELRGLHQVTLSRDLGARVPGGEPAPATERPSESAERAKAQGAQEPESARYTREDYDRFFETYFDDLNGEIAMQGASGARTASLRPEVERVIADNKLGQVDEVTCSEKLCRVVVKGTPAEARDHFPELFNSRMAAHFGSSTVHAPSGGDRIIGYFSKVDEPLLEPRVPVQHQ